MVIVYSYGELQLVAHRLFIFNPFQLVHDGQEYHDLSLCNLLISSPQGFHPIPCHSRFRQTQMSDHAAANPQRNGDRASGSEVACASKTAFLDENITYFLASICVAIDCLFVIAIAEVAIHRGVDRIVDRLH
jgi:hypothetical protein